MNRSWVTNLLIVSMGLALFAGVNARSGRMEANDGLGWDGRQYSHMVTGQLRDGTVATQTRPLLPLLTRMARAVGLDVIPAFQLMNVVYAGVLYLCLCLIFDYYGVAHAYKAYFVATVALCIATSKMFAFYPVQVDLGALAVLTAASYVILTRGGWAGGAAALLAVSARELSVALAFAGFYRELRHRGGVVRALLMYGPAVGAVVLLRAWATATNAGDRRPLVSASDFLANLGLWREPAFTLFFVYFALTLLGGVTVMLALKPVWLARTLAKAPELATFSLLILAASVVGNADIWRYLVFLLPLLAMLFAQYAVEFRPRPLLLASALVVTFVTQRPFATMDMTAYFNDWFPAYVYGTDDASEPFFSAWTTRIVVTLVGLVVLAGVQWAQQRNKGLLIPVIDGTGRPIQ